MLDVGEAPGAQACADATKARPFRVRLAPSDELMLDLSQRPEQLMPPLSPSSLAFEISPDRSEVMISSTEDGAVRLALSAADVDALMHKLAACRATMVPVHPAEPPTEPDRLYHNDNLLFDVSASSLVPAIEIAMQHPGLGWTVTRLSREQAEDLQVSIEFALQDIPKRMSAP
jgi:hypothetical protein